MVKFISLACISNENDGVAPQNRKETIIIETLQKVVYGHSLSLILKWQKQYTYTSRCWSSWSCTSKLSCVTCFRHQPTKRFFV